MGKWWNRSVAVISAVVLSVGLGGLASQPLAQAAPACGDYVWIGAAGSGERDGAKKDQNNGMGSYINTSYLDLKAIASARGMTVNHRALDYRAMAVPNATDGAAWTEYAVSAIRGVDKLKALIADVNRECGNSQVILAGYSQGAGVVHRALQQMPNIQRLAGGLLLADPDRLTYDTVVAAGTGAIPVAGAIAGQGVAQTVPTVSFARSTKLAPGVGSKVISYCQIQDPVCSYNPGAFILQGITIGSHTNYNPEWWKLQLADKILPAVASSVGSQFVGTWIGDVTEQMGGGGANLYGAIADLHASGSGIGGTLSFVRTQGVDGTPGYCTFLIEKSTISGNTLDVVDRKIRDTGGTCGGTEASFTRKGANLYFNARGQGTLYRIR